MPWPANSPDMNPIEHVWDQMGMHMYIRDTANPPTNLIELRQVVRQACDSMTLESIQHLGPVLLTFLRHVARISANGIAAFKENCTPIG